MAKSKSPRKAYQPRRITNDMANKFIGTELKPSYFRQAVGYLQSAESQPADLFSAGAA